MPAFALNFYSPIVEAQLKSNRKTATIRLGDKSRKYQKGMIVSVLVGARFSPRQHVFDAVIDKVEVKTIAELSPNEIEHDNPEIRHDGRALPLPRPALQPRRHRGRHGHADPLLGDQAELGFYGRLAVGLRMRMPSSSAARSGPPHSSQSTANVEENGASQAGQRRSIRPPQRARLRAPRPRDSTNQRRAAPQSRQNADQWPSTFRRSSRSQSAALPTLRL